MNSSLTLEKPNLEVEEELEFLFKLYQGLRDQYQGDNTSAYYQLCQHVRTRFESESHCDYKKYI